MLETIAQTYVSALPPSYGFDDVALVPGMDTLDPELCDLSWEIGPQSFDLPILAAAMDGVVDPSFALRFHPEGGLCGANLQGVQGPFEDPAEVYSANCAGPREEAATLLQDLYRATVQEEYVRRSVR